MLRGFLFVSAFFYAASLLALIVARPWRTFLQLTLFKRLLVAALLSHVGFTLCRSLWVGRLPFFGGVELLSWFALSCGALCLLGSSRLRSRFVIGWGVSCAFAVALALAIRYQPKALPDLAAVRGLLVWWYGFVTPLAYAAAFLAFAAQLRAVLALAQGRVSGDIDLFGVTEESMSTLSLGLVRLCYPLLLSGLLAFGLGSLETVGRGWFWQRSVAAQLFTLVAYSIYLHLCASRPASKGRIIAAQSAAFCGVVVSVLSFDLPQGLLQGMGLDLFF